MVGSVVGLPKDHPIARLHVMRSWRHCPRERPATASRGLLDEKIDFMTPHKKDPNLKLFPSMSLARTEYSCARQAATSNLVLWALCSFARADSRRTCFPTRDQLGKRLGLCPDTVGRALLLLREAGRITYESEPGGEVAGRDSILKKFNVYELISKPKAGSRTNYGLLPMRLFEHRLFAQQRGKGRISEKAVLLSLYLIAKGNESGEFEIEDLQREACIKSREKVLNALQLLQVEGLVSYTPPQLEPGKGYKGKMFSFQLAVT